MGHSLCSAGLRLWMCQEGLVPNIKTLRTLPVSSSLSREKACPLQTSGQSPSSTPHTPQ